jgi:xanthine dehydrogenase accessory factor
MLRRHEGHVGENDERRRFRSARYRGDAAPERTRQSCRRIGIDDDLETQRNQPLREDAVGIGANRNPASRRQLGNARRRVESQRHARDGGEQLVVASKAPRTPRREQDHADVPGLDHRRLSSCRPTHPIRTMIATTPADILRFALARIDEGVGTVLVTLAGIEGSSPRAIGAQMAVSADGRHLGSFSGGCIEAAVVAEAIDTLAQRRARLVRFGAGSPYLDIRLPCGGGIDLLFHPLAGRDAIAGLLARHARRELATLRLSMDGVALGRADDQVATGWQGDVFCVAYAPSLRLIALGQGEELIAMARLAVAYGADITALSPESHTLASLAAEGFAAAELRVRTQLPVLDSDPWTAILFLFHDRDWEEYLLPHALNAPAFYVGAIGSQRTQRLRLGTLEGAGVPAHLRDRLRTAVGLIPATRDPATLALSALAQIVEDYQLIEHGRWPQPAAHFETAENRRGPGRSR